MVAAAKKHMVLMFVVMLVMGGISNVHAQRLNFGISTGMFAGTTTHTIFDEAPFYFRFYAPYSVDQDADGFVFNPALFNQVRLAKISGIRPELNGQFKLGGNINYHSKNNMIINFEMGVYTAKDRVYYSFQNFVQSSNDSALYISYADDINIQDDYITMNRFINSYGLSVLKQFRSKGALKPYVTAGITERIQLYATYNSTVKQLNPDGLSNDALAEYINVNEFQNNLYKEMYQDGFNHYYKVGAGFRLYSVNVELNRHQSFGTNKTNYFQSQTFWELRISYDVTSLPLMK